jgi:hypothetical protein
MSSAKTERREAQERVAAYYESCLSELINQVGSELDRYRVGESDVAEMDAVLFQYHRSARELWKFCWAGGGSQIEWIAQLINDTAEPVDWWQRGAPRRADRS